MSILSVPPRTLKQPNTPEAAQYCARCGRVDRLDAFGLCELCRERNDVIKIDTGSASSDDETPSPPKLDSAA